MKFSTQLGPNQSISTRLDLLELALLLLVRLQNAKVDYKDATASKIRRHLLREVPELDISNAWRKYRSLRGGGSDIAMHQHLRSDICFLRSDLQIDQIIEEEEQAYAAFLNTRSSTPLFVRMNLFNEVYRNVYCRSHWPVDNESLAVRSMNDQENQASADAEGSSKQFKVFLSDLNDENRISTSKISTEQVCGRILGPNDFFTAQEQQMLHENNDMNQVCTSPPSLQANNPDIVDIDAESNVAPAQPQGWSPKKLSHADELLDSYNQAGSGTFYARKPLPVQLDLDFQTCSNERGNATSDMKYYVKLENSYD
ncbi:hypothetical protein Dda_6990 [Drechslerella dactyloides]|uniref:Uncharacterized protein n=1 Tax=Drechslerella dactyloides TaxID=74499 RepID=A0AAD6ITJ2_DREDA|nr:hypothetical protein Dda_6990 [Drechslerella dactyloides]